MNIERRVDLARFDRWASLGDGGNSGFQAVNLLAQMGARRIILVGFDMSLDSGIHWHGRHGEGLNNPREAIMGRWRKAFEDSAPVLAAAGVEVLNAAPQSRLEAYPKRPLEELLQC